MTLGQRIQELRRQNNLSQEALGDMLGVSRQAISKWESDITIPEVDKLIAMSKQFGVNVGVLLGVEEPVQEQESVPQELTDRELAAVETIVSRYIEQMEKLRPAPPAAPAPRMSAGKRGALMACALLLLIAAVTTVSGLNSRIDSLRNTTGFIQNQVLNMESTVTHQINSLTGQLKNLLEEQGSLLLEQSCTLVDYIPGEGGLFSLSARPKEHIPGLKAVFYAENQQGETVSQPALLEGDRFYAELWVPLWDNPTFRVELDNGQSRKTQPIKPEKVYMLASDFGLTVDSWSYGSNWSLNRDNVLELDLQVSLHMYARTPGGFNAGLIQPQECVLSVYYNGEGLRQRFLDESGWNTFTGEGSWWEDLSSKHTVDGEGKLEVILTGRDNLGEEFRWELLSVNVAYGRNQKNHAYAGATQVGSAP